MIAIDASALVAIAQREAEEDSFLEVLQSAEASYISPANYVETGIILISRGLVTSHRSLDEWLVSLRVKLRDDVELGAIALSAYLRYGRGFHPARLNLADCFAYALAKQLDAPLLYKGGDFSQTDIRSAV